MVYFALRIETLSIFLKLISQGKSSTFSLQQDGPMQQKKNVQRKLKMNYISSQCAQIEMYILKSLFSSYTCFAVYFPTSSFRTGFYFVYIRWPFQHSLD